MKPIIIALLMIFSISCRTIGQPIIAPQERCALSFQFNKCRCHLYDLQKAERVTEPADYPIEYCEDLVGFSAKAWAADITPWARESIRFYNDTCK
jgi:hypothetical protein